MGSRSNEKPVPLLPSDQGDPGAVGDGLAVGAGVGVTRLLASVPKVSVPAVQSPPWKGP